MLYRAVARYGRIVGRARHADRQQAMLKAARSCAARGGKPACCTRNIRVDG